MPETETARAYLGILVGTWSFIIFVWGTVFVLVPIIKFRRLGQRLREQGVHPVARQGLGSGDAPGAAPAWAFELHVPPQSLRARLTAELARQREVRVRATSDDSISLLGRAAWLPQINLAPSSDFSSARIVLRALTTGRTRVECQVSFRNLRRLAGVELVIVILAVGVLQGFPLTAAARNLLSLTFVLLAALMFGLRCWAQKLSTRNFLAQAIVRSAAGMPAA
jgi:hypothetical protein